MPIVTIQRRLRELGRLRAGEWLPPQQKGKKGRAKALRTWRITSPFADLVEAAAERYGGQVTEWTENRPTERQQWQVFTDATELDVLIPPGLETFSQWYELWSAGGCRQRCDGEHMIVKDFHNVGRRVINCVCPEDPADRVQGKHCVPTTRMSVMLAGVPDVGVWRVDTSSYYSATELLGAAAVAQIATERNLAMPGRLVIEPRQVKRPDPKQPGKQLTQKFVVVGWRGPAELDLPGMLAAATAATGHFGVLDQPAQPELPPPARAEDLGATGRELPPADSAPIEVDDDQPALPPPEPRKLSAKSLRMLHATMGEAGIGDDTRHQIVEKVTGGRTSSSGQLYQGEVDAMLAEIGRYAQVAEEFGGVDLPDPEPEQVGDIPDDAQPTGLPSSADEWRKLVRSRRRRMADVLRAATALATDAGLIEVANMVQLIDDRYAGIAEQVHTAVTGSAEEWAAFLAETAGAVHD